MRCCREGQGGGAQRERGGRGSGSRQRHRLRRAGRVIGHAQRTRESRRRSWFERHVDRAGSTSRQGLPQVPISTNEVAFVPPNATELMVAAAVPVFFTVTTWATLVTAVTVAGKAMDVGVNVMAGAAAARQCRSDLPFVETCRVVGNRKRGRQRARCRRFEFDRNRAACRRSQGSRAGFAEMTKEVAFVPVRVSDVSARAAVPEFFTVTTCAAVVTPTVVDAKVRLVGVRVTAGAAAAPVPVSLPFAESRWRCRQSTAKPSTRPLPQV